jgi:uncharacterized paraquat-inducible protein A
MPRSSTYRKNLWAGMCGRCGKKPPKEGRTHCEDCTEVNARRARATDAKNRAAGRCPTCRKPGYAPRKRRATTQG